MLEYQYDSLNRLAKADMVSDYFGEYSDYAMTYSPSGLVGIKSCDDMLWNYWHGYCSANNSIVSHQVRSIYDMDNDATTFFMWDASGRLQDIYRPCSGNLRHHWWNEADHLTAVVDNGHCAFYGYDGNGDRAYKLTGVTSIDQYNAGQETFHMHFNDAVLYPNPYIVISQTGYTKHYYAGTERLATVIGTGGFDDMVTTIDKLSSQHDWDIVKTFYSYYQNYDPFRHQGTVGSLVPTEDIEGKTSPELEYQCKPAELLMVEVLGDKDMLLDPIKEYGEVREEETKRYFYHGDHLGSANWITDYTGAPIQYIHYAPYGELIVNQTPHNYYDERYKFTGKERDWETGYDMFGARYLWSPTGHWLSVDPWADKYPWISPYSYAAWNPVKYVDPDGKAIHVAVGAVIGAAIGGTISGISAMNDPTKSGRQVLGAIAGGAVSGAITGGAAAATGGLSFIGTGGTIAASAAAGLIGESAGSAVSQGIGNGEIDGGEVARAGLVGAAAGVITGAASKGVSEAVKKSGVVQSIQTKMLDGVKSGTGKAAKQQANQTRKSIINFCSPGNDKQFQMKDLITYPADVVGQEVSTGATTSGAVVDRTQEVQSNVADKLGL